MDRVTIPDLQRMKREKKKIVMMTCYDYQMARIIDRTGLDMILVGDSGGHNLLGHEDNNEVSLDEMILMTRAVVRGSQRALVVGDMPFMTYQVNKEEAIRNAGRLIRETGCQAVKMELGAEYASTVAAVVKAGVPVMAHTGLTPMMSIGSGGFRNESVGVAEEKMWNDVRALEAAGAFSILLTRVPPELAKRMTQSVAVPTISGFGSGDDCDGRIGVTHGVLGFSADELDRPRANYGPAALAFFEAARKFVEDVRTGTPTRTREAQQRSPVQQKVAAVPYFVEPGDSSLVCETVEYKGKAGRVKAYLTRPKREKEFPAVLVIHENRGLNDHIRDVARRLAQEGFAALAPDFLSRLGGTDGFESPEKVTEVIRNVTNDQVTDDLLSGLAYLKTHPYVNGGKVGVVGFCWGGGQSLYFQTRCRELGAGVVYYGQNPNSLDEVQNIACPLLGIYGELDQRITGKVPELEQALKRHAKRYSIHIYPGAQHAFNNNTNSERYHPEAAKDAWGKTIAFLREHLIQTT